MRFRRRTNGTAVLSPTPLSSEIRRAYLDRFGNDTEFIELASLRRRGIAGTSWELRKKRIERIVVTGAPADLRFLGDVLRLMALLIPARERRIEEADSPPLPIRWHHLFGCLARVAVGAILGLADLAANWVSCLKLKSRTGALGYSVRPGDAGLYLKPTLTLGPAVGGSVGHVAGVVNALVRRRVKLAMLASGKQPLIDPEVAQSPVLPVFLPALPHEVNSHRYARVFLRAARRFARHWRPGFLYQRYSLNDLTGALLRRELGVPLILEFNGSETWVQRHWGRRLRFERISELIERSCLLSADLVVVVSEEVKRQVLGMGVPESRIVFYPNCVDASVFDPGRFSQEERMCIRRELAIPLDADLFTFVGTFGQWHGTDILAAAIRRLIDTKPDWMRDRRIHFLYVGDGQLAPRVRATLGEDLGGPFVTLAGFRPQQEAPGILAASDVLLSPHVPNPDGTPFFGSPTKLFEYMAMAKPIIASDLDQIGRVLRGWWPAASGMASDGRAPAAILIRPGDVDSLIRGIEQAAAMGEIRRRELGATARSYVLRGFTWDQNVAAVLTALDRTSLRPDPADERDHRAGMNA